MRLCGSGRLPSPLVEPDALLSGIRLPETGFSPQGRENMITLYPRERLPSGQP